MIVYAGKQFWNDFNNGDEALFQDANLPRDDFKFKIQHWIQATKQDRRTANKNISMAQALVRCIIKNPSWTYTMPYFKTKYASNDFDFIVWYVPNWWSALTSSQAAALAKECAIQSWQGDPCISVIDGNVVIQKSWTYILEAYAEFLYPTWYNVSTSYQYIEYVALKTYVDKRWWLVAEWTNDRACMSISSRKASYVTWASAGTILNVEAWQNSWLDSLVNVGLNAYRLS